MQAQEFAMAKWAIGLRLKTITEADIDQSFAEGQILRTHLMRPTWHFVSPADIRWLLALTAPRINAISAFMFRQLDLSATIFNRCNKIIEKELEGGKFLTRAELKSGLEKKKIKADGLRLGYIMMRAEIEGIICSGPRRGKQFTYALLEERVKPMPKISRQDALIQFTERYFRSRGPATVKDFASWSGLAIKDIREGVSNLPTSFLRENWKAQEFIFEDRPSSTSAGLQKSFLMPIYDEYGMSYKDRSHLRGSSSTPTTTIFNNMIIIDGTVAGGWTRAVEKNKSKIETFPFEELNKTRQVALNKALKSYMRFSGK